MKAKDYKPQIDGLRALAVLPVIFFHAGFNFFEGGFVGVDIFFVISGYLITNLILKDLSKNQFRLSEFYIRRSRRILPALYFITLVSILLSVFLLSPSELNFFAKQSISVILFISNFFFWKNSGYFDPNSELQPLLHTWSLGVEEQFYIFFPLFLIFLWFFFKKKILIFLLIISFFSLILSQIGGNFKIQNLSLIYPFFKLPFEFFWQAGSANFYLPFGRLWEILFGSIISFVTFKKNIKYKKSDNLLSILGIVFIFVAILFFSEDLQYPSVFTILPVLGTTLIILYANKSTIAYKIFSYKPLVFLGLISFSLYLWHQPLLAFSRIYYGVNLGLFQTLIVFFLTFILSLFTWKFVEKPFRNKKIINNKFVVIYLLSFSILILSLSLLIIFSKIKSSHLSLPQNISKTFERTSTDECFDLDFAHLDGNKWYCEIGDKSKEISFAVVGDSHALALKPAFMSAAKTKEKNGILLGFSGCPGLKGIYSIRSDKNLRNCKLLQDKLYEFVKEKKIKKVFLVSRWTYYTVGDQNKSNFNLVSNNNEMFSNINNSKKSIFFGIKNTLEKYKDINVNILFFHQIPEQIYEPQYVYKKSFQKNKKNINEKIIEDYSLKLDKHIQHQSLIREEVKKLGIKYSNFKIIDFDKLFCNKQNCLYGTKNHSFYADANHLSIIGALKTRRMITELID
ncbi:MAG: acyltransferase family protein [Pseudomonadota bacterium]|nr:acyltransferase family protein [Pseudomonadota bacterium]